jgi:hypothetical protein
MIFFFVAKLTDLFLGDDHFGELLRKFGGDLASGGLFVCEFCICSTNKVPGGRLFVLTFKIYEHTNRKWSLCNV